MPGTLSAFVYYLIEDSQQSLLLPENWGLEKPCHLLRPTRLVSSGARIHTQQSWLLTITPVGVFKTPQTQVIHTPLTVKSERLGAGGKY